MAGILPSASVSAIGGAATGDWWAPHAQRPPVAAAPSAGIGGYAGVGGVGSIGGGGSFGMFDLSGDDVKIIIGSHFYL